MPSSPGCGARYIELLAVSARCSRLPAVSPYDEAAAVHRARACKSAATARRTRPVKTCRPPFRMTLKLLTVCTTRIAPGAVQLDGSPGLRASAGYRKETVSEGIVLSGPGPTGALTETFAATPYRGEPVRLRASVRLEGAGRAQLQLRVDRAAASSGSSDNMGDRPITATAWETYEITGEVAPDSNTSSNEARGT